MKIVSIHNHLLVIARWLITSALLILTLGQASAAYAAPHISKTSFVDLIGDDPAILNWKTNDIVIPFDLPETIWVDRVEILISARPTGELRFRRNLKLKLNNAKGETLQAQGQRFDARVILEQRHLRRVGNKLTLSGIATSSTCAGPNHAGWEIDKERSIVVFYGRKMTRELNMRDLASIIHQPRSNAMKLGLKTVGEDSFRHEALITQSMTLRTGEIPQLRSAFSKNDIDVVVGTRSDIQHFIHRVDSRTGQGAQIILDKSRPPRIILTGDTPNQVRESVNAFAAHKLPRTRRVEIRPFEMTLQPALSNQRIDFQRTHKLVDAGILMPAQKWDTAPLSFNFDTSHAAQRTGKLVLRLNGSDTLSDDSSLSVVLNNKRLGNTKIDKPRKTIRLDIPQGYLIGTNNKLVINTDLRPNKDISICDVAATPPNFSLGLGSKMALNNDIDKNIHDVSDIASRSGPFVSSKKVTLINTTKRRADRLAALRLMGHLAYASGRPWTHVNFIENGDAVIDDAENILIVGPRNKSFDQFLKQAPNALRLALKGQKIPNIPDDKLASVLRVASLDSRQAFKLASSSARNQAKRFASGLISIYDDPEKAQTISIITAYPGGSFSTAAQNLIKPDVWNSLSGSVAQWDGVGAHMLQTARPQILTNSQPLYTSKINMNDLLSLDWEAFGIIHDDMAESMRNIWKNPAAAINNHIRNIKEIFKNKSSTLFYNPREKSRTLQQDQTATKDKNAVAKTAKQSVSPSLRKPSGASIDPSSTEAANTGTAKIISLQAELSKTAESVKSGVILTYNSAKDWAQKTHKNFDRWVQSVNQKRKSQGQPPIANSSALGIMILIFAGLLILGLVRPRRL